MAQMWQHSRIQHQNKTIKFDFSEVFFQLLNTQSEDDLFASLAQCEMW